MREPEQTVVAPRGWLAIWVGAISLGLLWLTSYSMTPGTDGGRPGERPAGSSIPVSEERPTLMVFLHPRCPCSRATANELSRLMARHDGFDVQPVFYLPNSKYDVWAKADLWDMVAQLSTKKPVLDPGGEEAARYAATTSGHVVLVSADGKIQFSGGITNGRGHEGDNVGLATLRRALNGETIEARDLPVYGCPITANARCDREQ